MLVFDTLQYSNKLIDAGFSQKQASIQAEALKEVIENNLATKHDNLDLKRDIEEVKRDIRESEMRMTIRLGSLIAFSIGAVAALVKLL